MCPSSIQQKIENMDYSWTNPQTALLLIPGLSFALQIIQSRKALSMNEGTEREIDTKWRKFANICKWSYRGSIIQLAACLIALKVFGIRPCAWVSLVSLHQIMYTTVKGLMNPSTFYDFNPSDEVIGTSTMASQNFFS